MEFGLTVTEEVQKSSLIMNLVNIIQQKGIKLQLYHELSSVSNSIWNAAEISLKQLKHETKLKLIQINTTLRHNDHVSL